MRPIAGRALWRSSVLRMLVCAALLAAYAWPTGALTRIVEAPPLAWHRLERRRDRAAGGESAWLRLASNGN
jgi:hypothetical protein